MENKAAGEILYKRTQIKFVGQFIDIVFKR